MHSGFTPISSESRDLGFCPSQTLNQLLRRAPSVRTGASDPRKQSAWPNDWFEKPSCCNSVAELEPIRNQPFHSNALRQRTHHVLQPLAHQHDLHAGIDQRLKLTRTIAFQLGLQLVLEVFFAQQIESVAPDPPQNRVHDTSRKYPVRAIKTCTHHSPRAHHT